MSSLRSRVVALVGISVLAALSLLALHTRRAARVEFQASIQAMRVVEEGGPIPDLAGHLDHGGWPAVRDALRASRLLEGTGQIIAVAPDARVLFAPTADWETARGRREPDGAVRLSVGLDDRRRELLMVGGWTVSGPAGDTVAIVFPAPPDHAATAPVDAFASALDRQVWLAATAILVLSLLAALVVSGRVLAPLRRLGQAAHRVGGGDLATRVGPLGSRELDEVGEAFDHMADSLERSEAARRRMIRDAAHELRSPLTNLRGQVESLEDGLRVPDAEALGVLRDEVLLLARLVDDLDELARAEARELDLRVDSIDLGHEVGRAVEGFAQSGRLSPGRITVQIPIGTTVLADRDRLGQILRNLVGNAFTHGGDRVSVAVSARGVAEGIELTVADDGPGIPPEHLPHVFERLYRADPSRARSTGGAGLGLSIVRELVRAHGGTACIESPSGGGTLVRVILPPG